jgi:hypothetical protein
MSRRELRFNDLDEVVADVHHLHQTGYQAHGKWDLSQIANHLADWMSYPMDGFPKMPLLIRGIISLLRVLKGKQLYREFVQAQRMPTGRPTAPATVHSPSENPSAAVERVLSTIERLRAHRGPLHPSPLFGELEYDQLVSLQLAHCAHHLSFLTPK